MVVTRRFTVDTQGLCDLLDITPRVAAEVKESQVKAGLATVFVPASTAALTTIEYEEGLLQDFTQMWDRLAPRNIPYQHDRKWGEENGFSHCRASLLGASLAIPLEGGKLLLGTWQQVVLVDFDNRPRRREVVVQVMGE